MRLLTAAVLSIALAAGATQARAQAVRGILTDAASGAAVADATVTLVSGDSTPVVRTRTGADGRFLLAARRAGSYSIRADREGYRPGFSSQLALRGGDTLRVTIRLTEMIVRLDEVEVEGRAGIPVMARAFYERMSEGSFGIFITREEVLAARARRTTDLLRRVPGMRLTAARGDGFSASLRGGCSPTVYIDGTRTHIVPGMGIDDLVQPGDLEGVEIYRSISEAPPQYQGLMAGCSAILFWTRIGPENRPR